MPVNVRIPAPLRALTEDQKILAIEGVDTVAALLSKIGDEYPELGERLHDADGSLRRFVNIFVNGRDIRSSEGPSTPIRDGDEVSIISAIAGGSEP